MTNGVKLGKLSKFTWEAMRDPIYDYVEYNKEIEAKIIDTRVFQRLRRIKQLQLTYLVYPGAEHSRFQHSIGVMHLAGQFVSHLLSFLVRKLGEGILEGFSVESLIEGTRIAGLLHDIGHGPFSHMFEESILSSEVLKSKGLDNHETLGLMLIEYTEISKIIKKAEEKYDLPHLYDIVKKILSEEEPREKILKLVRKTVKAWIYPSDIMDFLLRDSYYTGTKEYGAIDHQRLIRESYPVVVDDLYHNIAINRKALGALRSYFNSRVYMYEHVYLHPYNRSLSKLLKEVLRETDEILGLTEAVIKLGGGDPHDYIKLTDEYILARLMDLVEGDKLNPKTAEKVGALLNRRNPWKRIGGDYKIPLIATGLGHDPAILAYRYLKQWTADLEGFVKDTISEHCSGLIDPNDVWLDVNVLHPIPLAGLTSPTALYVTTITGMDMVDVKPLDMVAFMVREGIIPRIMVRVYVNRSSIKDSSALRRISETIDKAITEFFNIRGIAGGITL